MFKAAFCENFATNGWGKHMMRGIALIKSYDFMDTPSEQASMLGLDCWKRKEPYPSESSPGSGGSWKGLHA